MTEEETKQKYEAIVPAKSFCCDECCFKSQDTCKDEPDNKYCQKYIGMCWVPDHPIVYRRKEEQ